MSQNATREFISENEFNYLADIFNGILFSAKFPLELQLIAAIDESDPALLTKWNVDAEQLRTRIQHGFDENRVILVSDILRHWDRLHYHI